jgi:predicted transcriptional regulator
MPRAAGRPRGALEREVLASLAAADRPLSAADVQADLGDGLAYTTVMTTLSRLYAKHAVDRVQSGRAFMYSLPDGQHGAQSNVAAHRMLQLLDTGGDRAGVLARFVADLSPQDEQLLTELLSRDSPQEQQ